LDITLVIVPVDALFTTFTKQQTPLYRCVNTE